MTATRSNWAIAQSVEFLASVKSDQSIFLGVFTEAGAEFIKVINAVSIDIGVDE
ncbi:MAG TPA: hypothetical protein V6C85_05675 [Allocoleopsis sp.]